MWFQSRNCEENQHLRMKLMVHVFSGQIGTYSLFTCASFQITFKSCRQAWKALYTASSLDRHELWFYPAGEQYSVSLQTCRAQASSIFWYLRHNYQGQESWNTRVACMHHNYPLELWMLPVDTTLWSLASPNSSTPNFVEVAACNLHWYWTKTCAEI